MTLHGGAWAIEKLKVPAVTKTKQTPKNNKSKHGQYMVKSQNY